MIFHLELAEASSITVTSETGNKRDLKVTRITGGGRLVDELKRHARKAELKPDAVANTGIAASDEPNGVDWALLDGYDTFSEALQARIDVAFKPIYDQLDIEYISDRGKHGEIRLLMRKPGGTHTKGWVWKDGVRKVR